MQRRSANHFVSSLAGVFINFIQGIPVVVLLMVLYYVVFASASMSGIIIATIAFSINFGAYVSEILRSGIEAVDKGQWEASSALGFNKVKTFTKVIMELILFSMIFILIFQLVKKSIVKNLDKVNESLARITGGDLSVVVDVHSNAEFVSLSNDINSTVATLKRYIAEAAARIDKELEFARAIQLSSLPSVFPPFPARNEFSLFAQMDTAKEVGGDFYDFFFINHRKLVLIIADVAGKGIPAALFMVSTCSLCSPGRMTNALPPDTSIRDFNRLVLPIKEATNRFAGLWYRTFGIPICCITPLFITAILSETAIASS